MKRLVALALIFLTACACPRQWESDHVPYLIDESMPQACKDVARAAYDYWSERGATYLYMAEIPHEQALKTLEGSITVRKVDDLGDRGGKCATKTKLRGIVYARIRLAQCTPWVATHELGHALGLHHLDEAGNLMHSEIPRGYDLTQEQLEWVQ